MAFLHAAGKIGLLLSRPRVPFLRILGRKAGNLAPDVLRETVPCATGPAEVRRAFLAWCIGGARTTSIASSEALRRAYLRHGYALGLVSALGRR